MSGFDIGIDPFQGITGKPKEFQPKLIGDEPTVTPEGAERPAFAGALDKALAHVNDLQQDVGDKYKALAAGEDVKLHDIMMAAGKSEVAFNLMIEVRNKLMEAWQTLSRSVQ